MTSTSVIIPCYNVQDYLRAALDSVRGQTAPVREIILIDDGSLVPIQPPGDWVGPLLRLVRTENRGLPAARNLGISLATGTFVALLDADDLWLPRKVQLQENALNSSPGAVASYTRCTNEPGFFGFGPYPPADVGADEFLLVLWYNLFFPPSSVLVRRDALLAAGCFREDLGNGEDIELWLRLLRLGPFVQVAEPLCRYRQHDQQFTKNMCKKMFGSKQARRVMIEAHADRLVRAGLDRRKLWDAYRNDILLVYYRRDFRASRRLLWDYWHEHPTDLQILRYALISLLPPGLVTLLRGQLTHEAITLDSGSADTESRAWEFVLQSIRHDLAGMRL
jgi:glycosyltransferase involved in cell wall biosynthesis